MDDKEYLSRIISTAISLRKVKKIEIEEDEENHNPRPQMNVMVVSEFGTTKSTLLKKLKSRLGDDAVYRDEFTMAAFLGTIGRDRVFVPGTISLIGGKVLLIDEWNSVPRKGQNALLGPIENQMISRQLGFKVNKKTTVVDNEFSKITVDGGTISGNCQFSCIAFAMYYPTKYFKDALALLSRFSPSFVDVTRDDAKDLMKGKNPLNIEDRSRVIEKVIVKKDVWESFVDYINELLEKEGLYPEQKGFVIRLGIECIRLAIFDLLKERRGKNLVINNIESLKKVTIYAKRTMQNFLHVIPLRERYRNLVAEHPNKTIAWYSEKLRCSERYIKKLRKKEKEERGVDT